VRKSFSNLASSNQCAGQRESTRPAGRSTIEPIRGQNGQLELFQVLSNKVQVGQRLCRDVQSLSVRSPFKNLRFMPRGSRNQRPGGFDLDVFPLAPELFEYFESINGSAGIQVKRRQVRYCGKRGVVPGDDTAQNANGV
jgi:hypothetical protein